MNKSELPFYNSYRSSNVSSYLFRLFRLNEKSLIILLFLISLFTVFIILLNLPPDIQEVDLSRNIKKVFIPEFDSDKAHNLQHQHPPPPIHNIKNKQNIEKLTKLKKDKNFKTILNQDDNNDDINKKQNKIKEVINNN